MRIVCFKAKHLIAVVCCLIAFVILVSVAFFVGDKTLSAMAKRSLPVYCVDRNDKKISISFDCAWGVDYTDKILDTLDEYGVKCTFFAVEFWVKKYPEYAKKIVERGHELGTHSKTHPYMSKLSENKIREELTSSAAIIENTVGITPTLFRPPYGDYSDRVVNISKECGLLPIQWDVDSLDWKDLSATEISQRVIKRVKSGSIILCHNNGLHTAEALPEIFTTLQSEGYEFVRIGELVYKENHAVDPTGKQFLVNN